MLKNSTPILAHLEVGNSLCALSRALSLKHAAGGFRRENAAEVDPLTAQKFTLGLAETDSLLVTRVRVADPHAVVRIVNDVDPAVDPAADLVELEERRKNRILTLFLPPSVRREVKERREKSFANHLLFDKLCSVRDDINGSVQEGNPLLVRRRTQQAHITAASSAARLAT